MWCRVHFFTAFPQERKSESTGWKMDFSGRDSCAHTTKIDGWHWPKNNFSFTLLGLEKRTILSSKGRQEGARIGQIKRTKHVGDRTEPKTFFFIRVHPIFTHIFFPSFLLWPIFLLFLPSFFLNGGKEKRTDHPLFFFFFLHRISSMPQKRRGG